MSRDELEALIWRTLTQYGRPDAADVAVILYAAEQYGRDQYGITAGRRAVLATATLKRAKAS